MYILVDDYIVRVLDVLFTTVSRPGNMNEGYEQVITELAGARVEWNHVILKFVLWYKFDVSGDVSFNTIHKFSA